MTARARLEALATGSWLGALQLALGFSLMRGSGAGAGLYFGLMAAWLLGGAAGARLARNGRFSLALLALAVASSAGARLLLEWLPFSWVGAAAALAAGAIAGAYAGAFIVTRAARCGDARRLLLHENNGFLAGYLLGALLLFQGSAWLEGAAGAAGLLLLALELRGRRRELLLAGRPAGL